MKCGLAGRLGTKYFKNFLIRIVLHKSRLFIL